MKIDYHNWIKSINWKIDRGAISDRQVTWMRQVLSAKAERNGTKTDLGK